MDANWNYRVIEFAGEGTPYRAIHEVHYTNGVPSGYSEGAAVVLWDVSEGDASPGAQLNRMFLALAKPVLRESDFGAGATVNDDPVTVLASYRQRSEATTDEEKTRRALRGLDTMAHAWAEEVSLAKMAVSISARPDEHDRAARIHALVKQGWVEGAYAGRTSLETHPPKATPA